MYLPRPIPSLDRIQLARPLERLFLAGTHREAIAALNRGLRDDGSFVAITGEAGLGKTTLLNAVLADRVGAPGGARHIRDPSRELWQALDARIERGDTRAAAIQPAGGIASTLGLAIPPSAGGVIVIDDAHTLAPDVLRDLSTAVRLSGPSSLPPQIVFAGRPEFWSKLEGPDLFDVRERIVIRTVLFPMLYGEAEDYVEHLFRLAGSSARAVLPQDALHEILVRSQGNPRRINSELEAALAAGVAGYRRQAARRRAAEGPAAPAPDHPSRRGDSALRRCVAWASAAAAVALAGAAVFLPEADRLPGLGIGAGGMDGRAAAERTDVASRPPGAAQSGPDRRLDQAPMVAAAAVQPPPAERPLSAAGAPLRAAAATREPESPPLDPTAPVASPAPPGAGTVAELAPAPPVPPRAEPEIQAGRAEMATASSRSAPHANAPPEPSAEPSLAQPFPPAAPPPGASSSLAMRDDQAAGTTAAVAPSPAATTAPPATLAPVPIVKALPDAVVVSLLRRGDEMLQLGDISAARRLYERAAMAGSARAALAVGRTYDPGLLSGGAAWSAQADRDAATTWYRTAVSLGDKEAGALLERLGAAREEGGR